MLAVAGTGGRTLNRVRVDRPTAWWAEVAPEREALGAREARAAYDELNRGGSLKMERLVDRVFPSPKLVLDEAVVGG